MTVQSQQKDGNIAGSAMISQSFFDETVLENEDAFDLSPEAAVEETIEQLCKQQPLLPCEALWKRQHAGLSMTHPHSSQGQWERQQQADFHARLEEDPWSDETARAILSLLTTSNGTVMFRHLFWQQPSVLTKLADHATSCNDETAMRIALAVLDWQEHPQCQTLGVSLLPPYRQRQEQMLQQFMNPVHGWQRFFSNTEPLLRMEHHQQQQQRQWLELAYKVCQSNEPNKKLCNSKPVLQVLVQTLDKSYRQLQKQPTNNNNHDMLLLPTAACNFLTVLCRFDDFSPHAAQGQMQDNTGMVVSSAHSTVTTLGSLGIVPALHNLLNVATNTIINQQECLLLSTLTALRSMAIQDEIVQTMVTVGLLDTLYPIFTNYCGCTEDATEHDLDDNGKDGTTMTTLSIVTAMVGLYRNMSANDAIKTTLCRSPDHSILGPLIATMQTYLQRHNTMPTAAMVAKLMEHACATLGSMALRQPQNAELIVQDYQGYIVIIDAMRCCSEVPFVQRQGALALRNLASRATPEMKQQLLDAGAEDVLRRAGGVRANRGAAAEEAYAALRDLGCSAELLQWNKETGALQRQPMFGEQPLQFRKVFD